ncbi:MAG: sugar ABC transporter permease [Caldilineaceae bacterium]|nr:sugar ABC transporter permease [Caldilineaceae bacterium]MDE0672141.1 sugar ABC transporter permease [Caldilineaceae bacterium]MXZ23999.1 sugar ABC transporter permease [Caldilineaceae bacterium SB0665_bin_21]
MAPIATFIPDAAKRRRVQRTLAGYFFISPGLLGLALFLVGPLIYSLWLSLTEWDIISPPVFVGLENFRTAFLDDKLFWVSLYVTIRYTLVAVPLTLVAALAAALLLDLNIRGISGFRAIYYLPAMTPAVASVVLWRWIFNSEFGLLNYILDFVGLPKVEWLISADVVMYSFWIMALWSIGPMMIIFLAGLHGVPRTLYEAAEVDGANAWRKLWAVTIPQLSPVILFNLVIGLINTFQVFTAGYLLTAGGPKNATLFYVLYTYRNAFEWLKMGYAASLSWVLFAIVMVMTIFIFRSLGRAVHYEAG